MSILDGLRGLQGARAERQAKDPAEFHTPFPHQARFHRSSAKERWFIAGNRSGKSAAGAFECIRLITGRCDWWTGPPGEIWAGSISLADSAAVQRPAIRRLIRPDLVKSWTNELNPAAESTLRTTNGWVIRFKAYAQGRERWQGAAVSLLWFDEEPPGDIFDEGFTRTVSCAGKVIVTLTPLRGLAWQDAYDRVYRPWLSYQQANPGARHGEVAPGLHITTGSMADNPLIAPSEIEAMRRKYAHRPLLLRVRIDGEWLDISEDAIVPVDQLKTWDGETPREGWRRVVAWIDPAFSKNDRSDRSCISVAGLGQDNRRYLIHQLFGRWDASERVRRCADVLEAFGNPPCYVQKVTPDMEFRAMFNDYITREGRNGYVQIYDEKGRVPGKIERAESFSVLVGAGKVFVREEHEEFRHEAGVFPHGAHDDVLDSGMGALMAVGESANAPGFIAAVKAGGLGSAGKLDDSWENSEAWDDELEFGDDGVGWQGGLAPEDWVD